MPHQRPTSEQLTALSHVQTIAPSFRRARVELPEPLQTIFREQGLAGRHAAVLTQLIAGEPASVTDIAERLHVSLSTASELVGDLSRAELVIRREDPENRRRTLVSLSPNARPAVEAFITVRSAPLLRAMARLSPRDQRGFIAGLAWWATEEQDGAAP
ncbi:MarR family winged helix-turn-helix transcriptional regulator [Mycobacterium sp. NPDC003449]